MHGSSVLYPSCATTTGHLVAQMATRKGINYMRTTREKTPVLYSASESFPIGGSKVLRSTEGDRVTIVAAGITVHEALKAHATLEASGIHVRVIDAYCVKPLDTKTIRAAAEATEGKVIVVEDHWVEGGLGDAVLASLCGEEPSWLQVVKLGVTQMPGSGTPAELLRWARIDEGAIVEAVRRLVAPEKNRRSCYFCGRPASWQIMIAGEDEPQTEEVACELHAKGHMKVAKIMAPGDERRSRRMD